MVMKVDPGGFLSSSSVLACVAPFVIRSMEQGYIEPSMLTLYVLRRGDRCCPCFIVDIHAQVLLQRALGSSFILQPPAPCPITTTAPL